MDRPIHRNIAVFCCIPAMDYSTLNTIPEVFHPFGIHLSVNSKLVEREKLNRKGQKWIPKMHKMFEGIAKIFALIYSFFILKLL
jgi:hypothetical protein